MSQPQRDRRAAIKNIAERLDRAKFRLELLLGERQDVGPRGERFHHVKRRTGSGGT